MDKTYNELINKLTEYARLSYSSAPEGFVAIYLLENKDLRHDEILVDLKERITSFNQEAA
mgnify:CR=1 FL=1|jgi:hypothetical protein